MNAGFIGLGHLGKAIAQRLIAEGIGLTLWNRTPEKAAGMKAVVAATPADVLRSNDAVFVNLFDSTAVYEVMTMKGGLLEAAEKGKLIIDTTTNHFEKVLDFHRNCAQKGAEYLEVPVLGSVVPATQGALTLLVSGSREARERANPLLDRIGKNVFYLGQPGLATKMKLINNMVLGDFMAAISEAVVLAEKTGMEKNNVLDILAAGAGGSMVLSAKRTKLAEGDFSAHFSSAALYKDLHYLQDLARTLHSPLLTGSVTKELYAMTLAKGIETLDFSALYRIFKEL